MWYIIWIIIYEGKRSEKIVFYAQDIEISIKKASEILRDIKNILNKELYNKIENKYCNILEIVI